MANIRVVFRYFTVDEALAVTIFSRSPSIGPNKPQAVVNPSQVIWSIQLIFGIFVFSMETHLQLLPLCSNYTSLLCKTGF